MKRRALLIAWGALASLGATRAWAQPAKAPRLVGWLFPFSKEGQKLVMKAFVDQMAQLGHVEGRDFAIEGRWTDGDLGKLPAYAKELVALKPVAIVTASTAAIAALKKETGDLPILFAGAGDPVASGFVVSLGRPGGNVTGVMLRGELHDKLVDLVRDTLPAARRIALVVHDYDAVVDRLSAAIQQSATKARLQLTRIGVARFEEIESAFTKAASAKADAVIVQQSTIFLLHSREIGELAARMRLPLFSTFRNFTASGGLLSYYSDVPEIYRRLAVMLDKILRGAKPGELAVQQGDRYNLVINMRTAKALGIRMPQAVLIRADEVIE